MKTGFSINPSDVVDKNFIDFMESLLALFLSNSIGNAERYVALSNRNTITKQDMDLAMKYEAMEFIKDPNLYKNLSRTSTELKAPMDDNEAAIEETCEDILVVDDDDDESDPFRWLNGDTLTNPKDVFFIKKMNHGHTYWNQWKPTTPLEKHLKNAIDAMS